MKKKVCAMLMAVALCVGMLPSSVLAATVDEGAEPVSEEVGSGEFGEAGSLEIVGDESAAAGDVGADIYEEPDESGYNDGIEAGSEDLGDTGYEEGYDLEGSDSGEDGYYEEIIPDGTDPDASESIDDAESGEAEIDEEAEAEEGEEDEEIEDELEEDEEEEDYEIMTMAVEAGDVGISSFTVEEQIDGTEPWDNNNDPGNDQNGSNDIVRSFDYVYYTLEFITALNDSSVMVESSTLYVEFTLPCGPDTASFDMNVMNWMEDAVTTYYLDDGSSKTTFDQDTDKGHVTKQVLTGHATVKTPGEGTLTAGLYVGAASNGTTITPSFTAWMEDNIESDKVTIQNVNTLTVSAAPKYKLQIKQASGLNISDTYDLAAGSGGSTDQVSGKTSIDGRLEGYGVTIMMENDFVEKGLRGLEFPSGTITFDLTLSEKALDSSGNYIEGCGDENEGWTPVVWDYDENAEARVVNNSHNGEWGRTLFNYSWASGAAPANKLGQTSFNTVYDSCYDGGDWTITQTGPLTYSVTVKGYTIDYADFNFPTADLAGTSARVEPGSTYMANQACYSAGYVQCILQYLSSSQIDENTKIDFWITADNFKVDGVPYDASATYNNSYQLVTPGTINTQIWFGNPGNTSLSDYSNSNTGILGSDTYAGDAYSFQGSEVRINARTWISGDTIGKTTMEFTKWDADCFDVQGVYSVWWSNSASSSFTNGSWSNSCTIYYAGRDANWENEQVMSDTLINDTSITFYSSPEAVAAAGQVCVGGLLVADTYNLAGDLRIGYKSYIKDDAEIGSVYAACTEGWVSAKTMDELTEEYGALISGGKINTNLVRNGYALYKAYCSRSVYETMKDSPEQGDSYYHKSVYDDSGNIVSGNVTACYGGNSILICGEQCTVEIKTDKSTYNMDTGQRTATVTVTPIVNVAGSAASGSGQGEKDTTVTVTVTLPAGLSYDAGTAYWGDEEITPVVVENADGTTTLTFTLENVVAGSDPTDITFDCSIGHAGYADDVTNNQSLSLNATIASTDDNRTKNASFGNSSSTSITVVRLTSISIGKSVNHRGIEVDGDFVWTLTFYNGSSTGKSATDMADVLPANGDANGSSFSGDYTITEIDIDFSGAEKSYSDDHETMHFYVSNNYDGTGSELAAGGAPTDWYDLITAPDEEDDPNAEIITIPVPEDYQDMKAFYCDLGQLDAGETVTINLHVKTQGNKPGDTYNNIFYESASDQAIPVESNSVTTQVVQRNISGRTWIDTNKNGLQDSGEPALTNVTVTLYQSTDDGTDPTGIRPYAETQAKNVYGDTVAPVTTGANGEYSFECLPAGTYYIEFSNVNGYIYQVTAANVGTNDQIDSDASEVSNENGSLIAAISDVELPEIDDMDRYLYEDNYNDAGYSYITIDIEGSKEWDDADDQDGIRPDSIDVYLLADGERIPDGYGNYIMAKVEPDADGNWTFKFTELPKYNENGSAIVYTIEEVSVTGYETTTSTLTEVTDPDTGEGTGVYTLTITNKHEPETINISGEKVWDDADNQDGIRPGSVTINLLADGEPALDENGEAITAVVTSADDWAFSFTDLPKYKEGTEIQYNITEDAVDDYSTKITITKDEETGDYTVSVDNSYTPERTSLPVIKVWDDDNNADGFRPESITVKLLANGDDTGKTLTLDESNNWQGSFTELDVNTPVGQKITYTIEEISVDDYTTVMTGDGTTGFTITNKVIAPKLTKEVDEDDYERKEESGEPMHDGEDTDGEGWGSWDDADNNQEVTYRLNVSEIQNVANLTVHDYLEEGIDFEADTVEISLFDDGSETALTEGTDYTLTEGDCSDPECPMDGCTFEVTFEDDLFKDVSSDAYLVITYKALTDTHEADYDDYEDDLLNYSYMVFGTNLLSLRRSAVVIAETDLFGFGIYKYAEVDGSEVALSGAEFVLERSGMYATFETETDEDTGEDYYMISGWVEDMDSAGILNSDDEGMIRIEGLDDDTYTITETKAPVGYDIVDETITVVIDEDGNVTVDGDTGSKEAVTGSVVNVENTLILIDIDGTKTWNDDDNQDGYRPESITIYLLADGEVVDSVTVTEDDGWSWSFTDKPMYKDGVEITYTILEDAVDNYSTEYDGYDVINNHTPDQTSVSVTKAWDDADDQDGIRPESVTVQLYADGKSVEDATLTLDESNSWTGSFTELDIFRDQGERIAYTIEETDVPDGYECTIEAVGETGYVYVATNTHTPETTEVSGSKTWDDSRDQDGKRPSSITIRLLADGEEVDSVTVTEADNWAWSFTDLPKYSDGTEISYSVVEDAVDDYSTTYDGYDITNSYTPGKTSLTVVKVWDDGNNSDGIRAASVTVELLKDGVNTGQTIVLTADNNWTGSFTDLDEYTDGKLNVYSVQEVAVEGYTGTISGDATSGYVITNKHTPEKVNNPNPGTPNTGNPDDGNPNTGNPTNGGKTGDVGTTYLWILLMIAAAAIAVAGVTLKTRPRINK